MNNAHLELCASQRWADLTERELLPLAVGGKALGDDVLEIGPGPGRSTDVLRTMVAAVTALEMDRALAEDLTARMRGTNVEVVHADARELPFADGRFSAGTSFAMLHHVPSIADQDRLFAELRRVLRPGGLFCGVDTIETEAMNQLHEGDVFQPIDPATLPGRLEAAGFVDVVVEPIEAGGYAGFRFDATAATGT